MRKIFLYSLLLISTFVFGILVFYLTFAQSPSPETEVLPPKILLEDCPLLVVTGYSVDNQYISSDSLKKAFCAGKVYTLAKLKNQVAKLFTCEANIPTIQQLGEFAPLAKTNYLIVDINHLSSQFQALKIDSISFFDQAAKYPLWLKKDKPFDFKKRITKLMLTGCSAITRNTGLAADVNGAQFITKGVIDYFRDADLVHISNEVSISPNCVYLKYDPSYRFCTKERDFQALIDLSVDIVELTGNHNKDFGAEPYRLTMDWYQKNKIQTFGGGLNPEEADKPLIISLKDGKKLAFIGYNESCPIGECANAPNQSGANKYDRQKALKAINNLKKQQKIDIVWVGVQFNEVDSYSPSATQAKISRDLIEMGADVVHGSQAHQVQKIEFYKGKPIFHGLGNFMFDQIHRIGVRQSYFLKNYLYEGRLVQSIPVFTFISDERIPVIATPEQTQVMRQIVFEDHLLYK
ncbi:MAG: CapA family protein [Microscillaceae bacterium]|jgi:hypothetical protein|nr:CapA family protein [Microscillaceae bacterium]